MTPRPPTPGTLADIRVFDLTRALASRGCPEWTAIPNDAVVPLGPVNTVPGVVR